MNKNELTLRFAKAVVESVEMSEKSYDHKAVRKEEAVMKYVDYGRFYRKTRFEAIQEALTNNKLPIELAQPIHLSFSCWEELLQWANETLRKG